MRAVLSIVAALVAAWAALAVLAWGLQRQLIYLPDRSVPAVPDDVEPVALTTEDGLVLEAWYLAPDDPATVVLVAPGNAGNRGLRLPLARGLVDRGHAVLLLEYRGYGGNPGRPHEAGLLADARAARAHLERRGDVPRDRTVYLGESLGTGVVAALARDAAPAGLVLRSPFPSLAEVGAHHYPFLPVRTVLRDRYATGEHLAAYDGPTLVVAGATDSIVPTALSRAVAEEHGAELVLVADADHNDRALLDGPDYLDAVDRFLRRLGDV